jgi:hypothetical protein
MSANITLTMRVLALMALEGGCKANAAATGAGGRIRTRGTR